MLNANAKAAASFGCLADRLRLGAAPVSVGIIGTSITAAQYNHRADKWQAHLGQLLRARYPRANVTVKAVGGPGASAGVLSACLPVLRPVTADLYVVE